MAWVRSKDKAGRITFVRSQDAELAPADAALADDTILLFGPDGGMTVRGRACREVLALIGYPWAARALGIPPFSWIVELAYRLVARHRVWASKVFFRHLPEGATDGLELAEGPPSCSADGACSIEDMRRQTSLDRSRGMK